MKNSNIYILIIDYIINYIIAKIKNNSFFNKTSSQCPQNQLRKIRLIRWTS
jgi:hypothetical protein